MTVKSIFLLDLAPYSPRKYLDGKFAFVKVISSVVLKLFYLLFQIEEIRTIMIFPSNLGPILIACFIKTKEKLYFNLRFSSF